MMDCPTQPVRETTGRGTFEIPLLVRDGYVPRASEPSPDGSLPEPFLLENARWFCRLRWVVIALLGTFGIAGLIPGLFESLGLNPNPGWPFVIAGILALANIGYLFHLRLAERSEAAHWARVNLWTQITLDLFILTAVVYFVGSLDTHIAFAYLFHIVLACIFLSRAESFLTTLLAGVLYSLCASFEILGAFTPAGIYADAELREHILSNAPFAVAGVAFTIAIWVVVWYLTSHLAGLVRQRDHQLAQTNRKLQEAQEEKARHMVRTTHELKAPFAAIHANVDVLLCGYCGELPVEALNVLERVRTRCKRLAGEIQEMLHLASLRSANNGSQRWARVDLSQILRASIAQVLPMAEQRGIVFEQKLEPAVTRAVEDQMKLLFTNLISNAVLYSHEGGRVLIESGKSGPGGGGLVKIQDHGIGIPADKLPHIFEEYYRTNEAARHNPCSTGLGLAIVNHVVQTHRIRMTVTSRPGEGTTFTLVFPSRRERLDTLRMV